MNPWQTPASARSPTGIQVIVAEMLERRIKDPRLGFVTITDVRVTGDSQQASIFYTVLGADEELASTGRRARVGQGRDPLRGRQAARHAHRADADLHPRRAPRERPRPRRGARPRQGSSDEEVAAPRGRAYAGEADPYKKPRELQTRTTDDDARRRPERRRPTSDEDDRA